jgi:hypothetical protein
VDKRALLVGTATYTHHDLPHLPAVTACLNDFADVLDAEAITILDPQDPGIVLRALEALAPEKGELLLFYYVGHGLMGPNDTLCLGLTGSIDQQAQARRTSLPVDAVFEVLDRARAGHVVAILDCCKAGQALAAPLAHRAHLLMATDGITKADAPVGERYTAFTGALLQLCQEGVPDGPESLNLDLIFRHLDVTLRAGGHPAPHQSTVDYSGTATLTANPAHGTGLTREGLLRRARHADRAGRAKRTCQAVELFTGIVRDGSATLGPLDPDVCRFRRALAGWVGSAGDAAKAADILTALIQDLRPTAHDHDHDENLEKAVRSRTYWLSHS